MAGKYQFTLRSLLVLITVAALLPGVVIWCAQHQRLPEGIVAIGLSVLAAVGFGLGRSAQIDRSELLWAATCFSLLALSLIAACWLWIRSGGNIGSVLGVFFLFLSFFAFVTVMMAWLGLFVGLGLFTRRGARLVGIAVFVTAAVPLLATAALFLGIGLG